MICGMWPQGSVPFYLDSITLISDIGKYLPCGENAVTCLSDHEFLILLSLAIRAVR